MRLALYYLAGSFRIMNNVVIPVVIVVFVHDFSEQHFIMTRIKNIKNVTRCRDSRSAKSIETR